MVPTYAVIQWKKIQQHASKNDYIMQNKLHNNNNTHWREHNKYATVDKAYMSR